MVCIILFANRTIAMISIVAVVVQHAATELVVAGPELNICNNSKRKATMVKRIGKVPKARDGGRVMAITLVSFGLSVAALFLAAIALLWLSEAYLFQAVMNGPHFENAVTSPAIDATTAAIAVITWAFSLMTISHL